jgi:hypothetical protein
MIRRWLAFLAFVSVMAGQVAAQAGHHHGSWHKLPPRSVPELDGSMVGLAIALIGGGLAVLHGRRRRARS